MDQAKGIIETHSIVCVTNGMIFVGKLERYLSGNMIEISEVAQLVQDRQGSISVTNPMFPCSRLTANSAVIIHLRDMPGPQQTQFLHALNKHYASLHGIILPA